VSLSDIHGHDRNIAFLEKAAAGGKRAQAYLFAGPAGIGKRAVAVDFARALQCGAAGHRPCGMCPSCRKIDDGNHPDVRLLAPAREGASIKIDEVRELIRAVGLKPYEGPASVAIIDDAGLMTNEAQGALLKTFEEPSPAAVIILIADAVEKLLPTIVSRAQVLTFFPLGKEAVKEILIRHHGVDPSRAHILAGITGGRPGEAIRYVGDERFFERRTAVIDGLLERTLFAGDYEKRTRDELAAELDIMLTWFRDILVAGAGAGAEVPEVINIDRREAIARETRAYTQEHLDRIVRQILATGRALASNANAKLAMSVLGMEINRK